MGLPRQFNDGKIQKNDENQAVPSSIESLMSKGCPPLSVARPLPLRHVASSTSEFSVLFLNPISNHKRDELPLVDDGFPHGSNGSHGDGITTSGLDEQEPRSTIDQQNAW